MSVPLVTIWCQMGRRRIWVGRKAERNSGVWTAAIVREAKLEKKLTV